MLPIGVKSGKDHTSHSVLSNILTCGAYHLPQAIVFNNDNLHTNGSITYAPIYMVMFLQQSHPVPVYYKIDLSGLQ